MAPVFPDLTNRQEEVLGLTADGLTLGEIAHRLGIAVPTVRKHRDHAVALLGAPNTTAAAVLFDRRRRKVRRARSRIPGQLVAWG